MDAEVIVVGAGPVGLMLAGELRLGGAHVLVLERLTTPTTESRASTLHARTMELLDQRGLRARFGDPPCDPAGHFGGIPLDLSATATRYPGQWKVPQTEVELVLAHWALEAGARLCRGYDVVGLDQRGDQVAVRAIGPGGLRTFTARYVVGCDGEDSLVRELAGIGRTGQDATRELLRADVAGVDIPDRRFERRPAGLAIAARRPDGVTRVMVCESGRPVRRRTAPPSFEEVCQVWARVTGEDLSAGTPIWLNAFGNVSQIARHYRRGRVLLAGDAAHQQLPAGGQAINLGLQDAVNLGWKLAGAATGRVSDRLLDTYHDERYSVGRRVLRQIEAQALLLLGGAEVEPARSVLGELIGYPPVRDQLAGVITGLDVRYGDDPQPLVGARLPDPPPDPGGVAASLRAGRGRLFARSGDHARRLVAVVAGWRHRVDFSALPAPARLPDGAAALLLRPDGYVAWAGDTAADPQAALERWFGPATSPAGAGTEHTTKEIVHGHWSD